MMDARAGDNTALMAGDQENLARQFGLQIYTDLSKSAVSKELLKKVPYAFAKKYTVLPIEENESFVLVALSDPLSLQPIEELRHILNVPVRAAFAPREIILQAIHDRYNSDKENATDLLTGLAGNAGEDEIEVYDLLDNRSNQPAIIRLLNIILAEAIEQGASDIHFEPHDNSLRVRYRIDGVLHTRHAPSQEYQSQMLARVKVMAKLDIAEHRLPQDGRIKLKMGQREIDFRVSTVPVAGGERIVMRILDRGNVVIGLDKLNMPLQLFSEFKRLIAMPEGILLVTGPTGSGKTTTLYSALHEQNDEATNIMTIEDPVEYNLKGIAQIGVNGKINLTFARGLRHILRQDPDIIMVGEIRDAETAQISIQASLTGHLVMSTLHTNDAPSAVTRLVDMGVEPYLLSSTLVGVLAQRLVRRICPACKESYQTEQGLMYRGKGCSSCFESGYKGRQGIYELMTLTNPLKKQIVKSPDAIELRRLALAEGMLSLYQHGLQLVREGVTTLEEVLRVTRGCEEE
jgi:general secretion pathway protein E